MKQPIYFLGWLLLILLSSNILVAQINNGEICGNGFDDNNNGQIDENCYTCDNKQDNIWYFGMGIGLDFNNGNTNLLTNGNTTVLEGVSTIVTLMGSFSSIQMDSVSGTVITI